MSDDPVLAAIAQLRAEQGQLRGDLMARLDRLQNAVTAIRDDIAVNFGATTEVRRANEHTRDEVRALGDVVNAMQRQIQRLQSELRELRGEP